MFTETRPFRRVSDTLFFYPPLSPLRRIPNSSFDDEKKKPKKRRKRENLCMDDLWVFLPIVPQCLNI